MKLTKGLFNMNVSDTQKPIPVKFTVEVNGPFGVIFLKDVIGWSVDPDSGMLMVLSDYATVGLFKDWSSISKSDSVGSNMGVC